MYFRKILQFRNYTQTMDKIKVLDKEFILYLDESRIQNAIKDLANRLNQDLAEEDLVFVAVLNGSFMFAADLFRQIKLPAQISFVKLSSYSGTQSTGTMNRLIGLNEDLRGKTIVLLEDIIDTGNTLVELIQQLGDLHAKSVKIVSLLFKPEAYKKEIPIDYIGIEIPNEFIVGYGLDYNGFGRNLACIYKIV